MRVKRLSAPTSFGIMRKAGGRFAPTPTPGPHSKDTCVPLGTTIRDILGLTENMRETREALNAGRISVNGIVRKSHRFPVGIFDVVSVAGENYRAIPTERGFAFVAIPKKEADVKLVRVENKTTVRGGRTQVNFNDGTNLLTDKAFATGDTLVLKTPDLKIGSQLKRAPGALCLITRGRNVGKLATIEKINLVRGTGTNTATLRLDGREVRVPIEIVFVVGEKSPAITLGEKQ